MFIPLSSLFNLINALVAGSCALTVLFRRSVIGSKSNVFVSRFLTAFALSALQFFVFSFPGLLTYNQKFIQAAHTFGDTLTLVVMVYLVFIPLNILYRGKVLFALFGATLLGYAGFYLTDNLTFLCPATPVIYSRFIDWRGCSEPTMQSIIWGLTAIGIVFLIALFVANGWRNEDAIIRRRSRFLGAGFSTIFLGWLVAFLFTALTGENANALIIAGTIGPGMVS